LRPKPKRVQSTGVRLPKPLSAIEELLALQVRAAQLPHPVREYRFAPPRLWRADFGWPERLLLVECEGGVWSGGRHTRGSGYVKDLEKYNEATVRGFRLLRFDGRMIESGQALKLIEYMLSYG